ncbi:hypothetical protein [Nostoc parmelioides]|uniref:Uncharacterized protein n=1 Tax=Nostoc parmelioides FACHB-3921 TaxID=2692909 RepID=A0ABR8BN87_9NOSO|nr:hypothetical protein [Nostoc parmelioides]MBD2255144.1 hypothetical protein [Nostoc parmelioides FACHB-3921]
MSSLPFEKLLQDNPQLLTSEGLSALLGDCIHLKYTQHHRFTYPSLLQDKNVYLGLAQLSNPDPQTEQIIRRFKTNPAAWDTNGCLTEQEAFDFLFLYRRINDNIHQLQKNLGISGVCLRHIAIRDRLFSYPTADDQMLLLESDRTTLQNAVPGIIKYFLELVQMPPAYNLFLVDQDEQKISANPAAVQEAAARALRAEIYCESHEWIQTGANYWESKHASKVDPDEMHLCLHLDWEEDEFIFFDAHHSDPARWPWGND